MSRDCPSERVPIALAEGRPEDPVRIDGNGGDRAGRLPPGRDGGYWKNASRTRPEGSRRGLAIRADPPRPCRDWKARGRKKGGPKPAHLRDDLVAYAAAACRGRASSARIARCRKRSS